MRCCSAVQNTSWLQCSGKFRLSCVRLGCAGDIGVYQGISGDTMGYHGISEDTMGYQRIPGDTRGCQGILGDTRGYWGYQGYQWIYVDIRDIRGH